MSKARLVITAVVTEGRSQGEVARGLRGVAGVGLAAGGPVPGRGRGGVRAAVPAAEDLPGAIAPRHRGPDRRGCARSWPGRAWTPGRTRSPGTWAPPPGHGVAPRRSAGTWPGPGLVAPEPRKRPKSSYIRFEAELPNECWQSDFTHYPLAGGTGTEILTWLDDHSRLRAVGHRPPPGHRPGRARRVPRRRRRYGAPASTLTDNGMVFTTRLSGGKGGRNGLETELRRLGHHPEERPAEPPPDPGQGRAVPADPEEMAARPARPARHPRRAPGPPRRLRRRLQPPPPAPVPAAPGHPRHRLRRPAQSRPRRPRRRHPRPRPHRPHRRRRHRHPAPPAAACTTSASAEPTPEPTSCCSSRTSTSASSTPPPASSSANSPSTQTATTSPPAAPRTDKKTTSRPVSKDREPLAQVRGHSDVLRHHTGARGRIRTCDRLLRRHSSRIAASRLVSP